MMPPALKLRLFFGRPSVNSLPSHEQPYRGELYSIELLQRHARILAQQHRIGRRKGRNRLLSRLSTNERSLRHYNEETLKVETTRRITPAAEWLLDNFYLIDEQIRMVRQHLPRSYSRELPHLTNGPTANLPRVYDLAWELIAHVDGRVDATHLASFIAAYQETSPLTLGELWAVPIMLRLALIENLRRVAASLTAARKERDLADYWADRLLSIAETEPTKLIVTVARMAQAGLPMTEAFVTEFWQRTQQKSPMLKLALNWLEEQLVSAGLSVELLIQNENQDQAAKQVSVGNSIASLRFLDAMDWREFVETLSIVEQNLRTDPASIYGDMDFQTRDLYRHIVEETARHSRFSEREVSQMAIDLAQGRNPDTDPRQRHVGYFLVDEGLAELERATATKVPLEDRIPRMLRKMPLLSYVGSIAAIALISTAIYWRLLEATAAPPWQKIVLLILVLMGASQLGVSIINWLSTLILSPRPLPRLDFSNGIPAESRTLVVIPTMLSSKAAIESLLEALEVRYLANRDDNVYFALLTDWCDAPRERMPDDDNLLGEARAGIQALNKKYRDDRPSIFHLFHRPRLWNEREGVWMGYERKRGKLSALNRMLRGGGRESFLEIVGDLNSLPHIQHIITLDTDTQLPRDTARQLAATMAHPLNCPTYDPARGRITRGYAILQPRVAISLPSAARSRFARLFAGDPGIDPYTRTVSDVYQDLFREGSFIGKGIYHLDGFEQAVGQKFPENRILSHDLLEGSYARSALVTDVQLFEDFPGAYTADARRRHRWMRGDWQIGSWLLPWVPGPDGKRRRNPISLLSRWKVFDNLRRSLMPLALLSLLIVGWTIHPSLSFWWSGFLAVIAFLPAALLFVTDLVCKPRQLPWTLHWRNMFPAAGRQFGQGLLFLAFLPFETMLGLDAIARTITRMLITRRKLLEWQTASEVEQRPTSDLPSHWRVLWGAPMVAVLVSVVLLLQSSPAILAALPYLLLWLLAPVVAWWVSRPLELQRAGLTAEQHRALRVLARKTWRFFETFVTATEHWLPPDNFQEHPRPVVASRTSPTNIGMSLMSTLAAWDFGYVSLQQFTERIQQTLATTALLSRHQSHFYNWYDTRTLQPLQPLYISTVDNGNLAAMLLTLREALLETAARPFPASAVIAGLQDSLRCWLEEAGKLGSVMNGDVLSRLRSIDTRLSEASWSHAGAATLLTEINAELAAIPSDAHPSDMEYQWWRRAFQQLCQEHREELLSTCPWTALELPSIAAHDLANRSNGSTWQSFATRFGQSPSLAQLRGELAHIDAALGARPGAEIADTPLAELKSLRAAVAEALQRAQNRVTLLEQLAQQCDELAQMDFTFLYDSVRKLFVIGYNASHHRVDNSHYDLLASEARLCSFVAIALGQVPQDHWFALGRLLTAVGSDRALLSWSGSMFEYLMPPLIMPSYEQTLLDVSCQSAVARQIDYGRQRGVPWGMSESGYNLTDAQANYQYRAFGVPGLGFKRGLAKDLVVAPYATLMSFIISPQQSWANLIRLRAKGAEGRYGFFEAIDFTPSRLRRGESHVVVQSFMAHHQGMALLALAYCLLDRPMQRRFQANPRFRAAELLLQERVPKETAVFFPHELEATRARDTTSGAEATFRVFTNPSAGPPEVHLLSNGRYHVMVTAGGGGYSHWNETALTRWREDPTRDCWGAFIYLRDRANGQVWSATDQPMQPAVASYEAIFSQGRAEYRMRFKEIDSHIEISVSPEDDIEVRRITLTNHSSDPRTIELTTFGEVALTTSAADQAHPAFSKLFVQTQILRERHAIVCSRRPRARGEQPPWMFHLILVQGETTGSTSFETDRARFLGRGRTAANPAALETAVLSNTEGPVLDPAIAIRRVVHLEPNQSVRVSVVTGAAATREAVMSLVEKYQDHSLADRVFELAWTHGLVTLRHLNATEPQTQLFGRLAGPLLYCQPWRRAASATLMQNRRGQRNLWSFGISGDLPILLLRCSSAERVDFIREMLTAHAYLRLKGLAVDLVILNEDDSSYRQSLHDQIISLIASGIEAQLLDKPGGIFVRRSDQLSYEDNILLQSCARVVLSNEGGLLAEQMQRRPRPDPMPPPFQPTRTRSFTSPRVEPPRDDLVMFNGLGGFTPDGREYVMLLPPGKTTPAPWANVIANPNFGTLVTESGGAYTWAENCHEFRLTTWHNDPVTDATGEAIYIRDEMTGRVWSPTPQPAGRHAFCRVRHGFGYSVFEMTDDGIASELWIYVATDAPIKFVRLILRNLSGRERALSVTGFWEWVLGETRSKNLMHIATELDARTGALLARNAYNADFTDRVAFVAATEAVHSYTADRTEFLGRHGTLAQPAAMGRIRLGGKVGMGLDACAALRVNIELPANEQREVVFRMGAARDREEAQNILQRFRRIDACRDAIYMVRAYWNDALTSVQVQTPDRPLNLLANGWLLYQTISARLFGRTGFYQSGGAFGFRDQLQDAMALIHSRPQLLREQLLRAAAHQFRDGDVQHWWHPPGIRGVRTHFSDDYLWLPYATCRYVEALGDVGVLDEQVAFVEGRPVRAEEEAYYDAPIISNETASLYDHCVWAIRYGLRFGAHGLPLIGCGDWNDGMNLVGEHGKGESVWLAFFLYDVLKRFANIAHRRGDKMFASHCLEHAEKLQQNIEAQAWDGGWYRRAYFDNGEPLGSASNPECQIDSLPQSWAVLTGAGDPRRARAAMDAVDKRLVRRDARLIQLFDPPFNTSALEPGYIKGYLPGVRENGGQYTHGAVWTVMAFAALGDAERAWELFELINPLRHAETPSAIARYKVEPYVVAADIYSVPPHTGRGGWTWYTGSAGWLYRLILESLLGLKLDVDRLRFSPCLPSGWKTFSIRYRYRETQYQITLLNIGGKWTGNQSVTLDGVLQPDPSVLLQGDRREHTVEVRFN